MDKSFKISDEKIAFVCIHNKRRSVMAESFAKNLGLNAYSAGVEKTEEIDEKIVEVMAELGLKVKERPETILELTKKIGNIDILVTMGCIGSCPIVPAKKYIAWNIKDPAGKEIEVYRKIRDEIKIKVEELLKSEF
ncbi:arsenate reductase ArsC [Methanococcus maripaludis]|uniref:Arsenate reductase ArsC n=3 Tax=Methanococcus maripaludis TaxID=39152 RepID=A0A8T3W8Z3_METMI|nr:arsenate reductase ArsC [Methanococcus maripaludis]MBG0769710.1 arsenate reductase ArsC [Methanococcus maripaludis]BAP60651.1 arsenate reductase [Methanococcus maripaludis KA1]BAP62615.1 arsenate reductase [Methanococcus maripaludis OS7]